MSQAENSKSQTNYRQRTGLQEHYDTIEYLDKKITAVTERMATHVADDAVVKQLLKQPGVGIISNILPNRMW